MDDSFTDGDLVEQFVEIVATLTQAAQAADDDDSSEEEHKGRVTECLEKMSAIYQAGHSFERQKYINEMARRLKEKEEQGEDMWPVLAQYCTYIASVEMTKVLPAVGRAFKHLGWREWTPEGLQEPVFEDVIFQTVAKRIIDAACRELKEPNGLDFEVAQTVWYLSTTLDISLPAELRQRVNFLISGNLEEFEENETELSPGWIQ